MSDDVKVGDLCEVLPSSGPLKMGEGCDWLVGQVVEVVEHEKLRFYENHRRAVHGFVCAAVDGRLYSIARHCLRTLPPKTRNEAEPRVDDLTPAIADDWAGIGWSPSKTKAPA